VANPQDNTFWARRVAGSRGDLIETMAEPVGPVLGVSRPAFVLGYQIEDVDLSLSVALEGSGRAGTARPVQR